VLGSFRREANQTGSTRRFIAVDYLAKRIPRGF